MATKTIKLLSRGAILAADDMKTEDVHVAAWGGDVRVRSMNAYERDAFEQSMIEGAGPDRTTNLNNFRAKLVAHTCIDDDGKLLFTMEDAHFLGEKSADAISRVFEVAQRLSGMARRDVEQLTGNFSTTQNGDSPID